MVPSSIQYSQIRFQDRKMITKCVIADELISQPKGTGLANVQKYKSNTGHTHSNDDDFIIVRVCVPCVT